VADDIVKNGGQAIAVPGDMLDTEYLKVLVKKTAEFGNGKIHIIVNNAGSVASSLPHFINSGLQLADIPGTA
jgi:3-oxoacyl-[acyl-carrier protein] reductase